MAESAQRLGLWEPLLGHAACRAFALVAHRVLPRIEPQARAESLEFQGQTLVIRVSSSAVASELSYVKDLLLEQVNAQLATLTSGLSTGKRPSLFKVERLKYKVGPVKALPDFATWSERTLPPGPKKPQRLTWDLDVAAAMKGVRDESTRDALAALYAAAVRES
jgi:hypothetical protein